MARNPNTGFVLDTGHIWIELPAIILAAGGLIVWSAFSHSGLPFVIWSVVCALVVLRLAKFDYLNPLPAFIFPWLAVSVFGQLELSRYARPLAGKTYATIWALELAALLTYYMAARHEPKQLAERDGRTFSAGRFSTLMVLYGGLTLLNVALAGYVPLISGILSGDPGYLDFGVHGIYGFYNAFANALGVFAFFLYCRTRRKSYLYACLAIGVVFILFVSRQNIISMLVECVVVYSLSRRRISRAKLITAMAVVLVLLSVAGDLRSGDIKTIAGIKDEYQNVPGALVWVYAYSYFNVVNLDNVISNPQVPTVDGSSVFSLLPTFIRPETSLIQNEIEVEQFNAYSYVAPIYADLGLWGTVLFTIAITWWGVRSYQRALLDGSFYSMAKYSVLFFCALFSFFVNLWFYLPIISEIPILAGISWYVLKPGEERAPAAISLTPSPS
jgi:oligosaccharide repeat unit polymerase